MKTLVLSARDVRRFLDMSTCVDLMSRALVALAEGSGFNPLRWAARVPDSTAILGMMPGALERPNLLGMKALAVMPGNAGTDHDCHQGVVLLFDPDNGFPQAILDASSLTEIRTAAVSAAATRALAVEEAEELAILGSGVQARSHLTAMCAVRPIRRVRVYSPNPDHRAAFLRHAERDVEITACATAREAVDGAQIICTVTSSATPVLEGQWLQPGSHINAVGACLPTCRELDSDVIQRSRVFVDRLESAQNEAGDILLARKDGVDEGPIGEVGDVFRGAIPGRTGSDEITLFKSLGIAVEDLVAAHHVYERASKSGAGTEVDLGGLRHGTD